MRTGRADSFRKVMLAGKCLKFDLLLAIWKSRMQMKEDDLEPLKQEVNRLSAQQQEFHKLIRDM